ncbi:MAG: Na+/H+ antiporter NhaC family protein, partial [Clostridia bacterium]|nr:Na+/H+ antiporter NhaC family protein [Clostridia bacterium]
MKKSLIKSLIFIGAILLYIVFCFVQTPITSAVTMNGDTAVGSMWSLLPPIIAIGLALITKEVYSSL